MDERLRREYLKTMGITVWERRDLLQRCELVQDTALPSPDTVTRADPAVQRTNASSQSNGPQEHTQVASRNNADLDWDGLRNRVKHCSACGLRSGCTQTVFGVGNTKADLLVIGEAPGADEDRQGEPFVGRAGQLLNAMLLAMGFKREDVFIANILKCRPPDNRDPKAEEALKCEPFLLRQIELIQPRVILSVGRISAQNLLKTEIAVGKLRGRVHYFGTQQVPLVVTYHPAYLLRSPEQKAKSWDDLQLTLSLLSGMLQ